MAPKFGTSGLRGLVLELTPALVADHVRAFIASCDIGAGLCVGWDLRPSSPRIAAEVIRAARSMGIAVVDCGAVPTPALALAAYEAGMGAVMVTGSHIPADRNGLKFYSRHGEIGKAEEQAITAHLGTPERGAEGPLSSDAGVGERYVARYVSAFGPAALAGRKIGNYSHSAVGRDLLAQILTGLGAEVVEFGRSETFIPVDTEAVDPVVRAEIARWVGLNQLDALVSLDGDSDRPLLATERGRVVAGDVMGQISAEVLGAETVVTPVSSNSGVGAKGFAQVIRTKIGSPYVIAGMEAAGGRVVGYEANGGFLLGFAAEGPAGPIAALPTRDAVLPILCTLIATGAGKLSERIAAEPPVITAADRLQDVPQEKSQPFVAALASDGAARAAFLAALGGSEAALDLTDGVRMTLADGRVVHVRPSGNAPELRLYVEGRDLADSEEILYRGLSLLREKLG